MSRLGGNAYSNGAYFLAPCSELPQSAGGSRSRWRKHVQVAEYDIFRVLLVDLRISTALTPERNSTQGVVISGSPIHVLLSIDDSDSEHAHAGGRV